MEEAGHTVLRLPPYTSILNPIENMWGILKTKVARELVNMTMDEARDAFKAAHREANARDMWRNTVLKTQLIEDE